MTEVSTIEKALELWTKLTGYEPNKFQVRLADEWSLRQMGDCIREALELDATNVTGSMLLSYFTRKYLDGKGWSANDILKNYDQVVAYLRDAHELYQLLDDPEIVEPIREYQAGLIKTLDAYGLATAEVCELVNDLDAIAFLRRDALKSIEKLMVRQFLQGEPDGQPARYSDKIYAFWNINSLIKAMAGQPGGGISLALIKTPDDYHQYFVYVIRNGGTLSIVTDKPQWRHPLQGEMMSARGRGIMRDFSKRSVQNYFPYQLCGFEEITDEDGESLGIHFRKSWEINDLVAYQTELFQVGKLSDLPADQIVWNVLMLDLIKEKFWKQNFKTKELCYTGEMVKVQNALIDTPEAKALAVTGYKPLVAPVLTVADVVHEKVKNDWDTESSENNRWLEERYKDRIGGEMLNLMSGNRQQIQYVTKGSAEIQIASKNDLDRIPSWQLREMPKRYGMQALDPEFFGTEEEILKNQRWVARHNMASLIQVEADKEFEERKDKVKAWYQKAVGKNIENLCHAAKIGKFEDFFAYGSWGDRPLKDGFKNDGFAFCEERVWYDIAYGTDTVRFTQGYRSGKGPTCYFTGAASSYIIQFTPTTGKGLAALCGCDIKDLPDVLQHWKRDSSHNGNHILDNLDPVDWVLHDPWSKLKLTVQIYLSKRAFAKA